MELNHKQKIHEAAGKERHLDVVQVTADDIGRRVLRATDGRILAVVPCEGGCEDGFRCDGSELIHRDGFVEVLKGKKGERRELVLLEVDGEKSPTLFRGTTTIRGQLVEDGRSFPKVEQVLRPDRPSDFTVTLNAEYLLRLVRALGADAITLRIPTEVDRGVREDRQVDMPVKVVAHEGDEHAMRPSGAYGVIMPVVIDP